MDEKLSTLYQYYHRAHQSALRVREKSMTEALHAARCCLGLAKYRPRIPYFRSLKAYQNIIRKTNVTCQVNLNIS